MKQKLLTLFATLICSMTMVVTSALAAPLVYTVYDASTQTLTYRYDNGYDVTSSYNEVYDPVNFPTALTQRCLTLL